jgi:hypothetical protein
MLISHCINFEVTEFDRVQARKSGYSRCNGGGDQMSTAALNIIGLVLNPVGVIILFRYGMPFHVPTGGAVHIIAEQVNAAEKAFEGRYEVFGCSAC